ncbi:amidohydrolase family protein [Sphingomonas sp. G-3-2-10]|uniref:amidohydrolase family protein n=1 Tax=Sphingomonas sp. G-3-2-10 TaxID=2728838 RepID=UPI00146A7D4A|nr:amidohydrolase family protein [Sphingomonas sp. G-3-2-10]NML07020.1 amidohydrolase family protein [Sphingomonas sp. G-3-2-10]
MIRNLIAAFALLFAAPVLAQSAPPAPKTVYIHAGTLLDKPGEKPRGNSTIIVRDGKVVEVRDGFVPPAEGATVVDLRNAFVLPGLIDLHVHLFFEGDPMKARLEAMTRTDGDEFVIGVENARLDLEAGFTTVRDLGSTPELIRALRDGIDRGAIAGPTVVNAGLMISVTGGHGDGSNGLAEPWASTVRDHQLNTCDGADDCRRAVRAQIGMGALVIKFAGTGGVLSNVAGGLGRQMTPDEMKAIVETAHSFGRRVAVHAHAEEGIRAAVEAGVDTVDHGTFLTDSTIALMKSRGTWLVPTMLAPQTALKAARAGLLPPATVPKAEQAAAAAIDSHRRAIRAGVRIAFGTDTGVSRHGINAQEFGLMVGAGMTPMGAIRAATIDAADALGRKDQIGSIEPGKWADIIAVTGDPLADVTRLERVDFVMRRGVVHKLGGKRQAFPAD